jgi:hypothetical protein
MTPYIYLVPLAMCIGTLVALARREATLREAVLSTIGVALFTYGFSVVREAPTNTIGLLLMLLGPALAIYVWGRRPAR